MTSYDALIIGCGGGGGVMFHELAKAGFKVAALDEGPRFDPFVDYKNDELYAGKLFGNVPMEIKGNDPVGIGMVKAVGGGTNHYSAVYPRFHMSDFKTKTLDSVGEDWPIDYRKLEPYYDHVENFLGVSGLNENPFDVPRSPFPNPPHRYNGSSRVVARGASRLGLHPNPPPLAILSREYDGRPTCNQCGFCFQGCMLRDMSNVNNVYVPKALSYGGKLLERTKALRIKLNKKGEVDSVITVDRFGSTKIIKTRLLIVACNSINTPRLLLFNSSGKFPNGLANHSGLVGRNLMHHTPLGVYGRFPEKLNWHKGIPQGPIIQDFYETNHNNGFVRGYTLESFSNLPITLANEFNHDLWGEELVELMDSFAHLAGFWVCGEDLANPENRVQLHTDKIDEDGIPIPLVTYSYGDNDKKLMAHAAEKASAILLAGGADKIWTSPPSGSAHLVGTCRMGDNPETSVVNSFGQSHDVKNLFITDGSIFVTSAAVNPTLTIQALATRSAEYIVKNRRNFES